MSLIFSAVIPNHPKFALELLPSKETESQTVNAVKELEGEMYFMKPETIVLLTSHGSQVPDLINANISSSLRGTWPDSAPELQDIETDFHGDVEFAAHLKEVIDTEHNDIPMTIIAEEVLPPEITTPFTFLLSHLKHARVVIISTSNLTVQQHYDFGEFLRHQALQTNKRIAVIASGHLSNYKKADTTTASSFDTLCQQFIKEHQPEKILNINKDIYTSSGSDLYFPLTVMVGLLNNLNTIPEVMSYEKVFDQGQLVANFILK